MIQKWGRILLVGVMVCLLASGMAYWLLCSNVHEIVPGQYYRSAQLSSYELSRVIKHYGIKSVINLRGTQHNKSWYVDEKRVVDKLNVHYYNLPLGSHDLPSFTSVHELVHLLKTAPQPLLFHCLGGSDLSGLASAIAMLLAGDTLQQASDQVSWRYLTVSKRSVGRQFLPLYALWLDEKIDSRSTPSRFMVWLDTVYAPHHLTY